jgi:hypothetical protein
MGKWTTDVVGVITDAVLFPMLSVMSRVHEVSDVMFNVCNKHSTSHLLRGLKHDDAIADTIRQHGHAAFTGTLFRLATGLADDIMIGYERLITNRSDLHACLATVSLQERTVLTELAVLTSLGSASSFNRRTGSKLAMYLPRNARLRRCIVIPHRVHGIAYSMSAMRSHVSHNGGLRL